MADRLDGQHVLLTGVTGFVGEALLQLMLALVFLFFVCSGR